MLDGYHSEIIIEVKIKNKFIGCFNLGYKLINF